VKRRIRDIAVHVLADLDRPVAVTYSFDPTPNDSQMYLGAPEGAAEIESLGMEPLQVDEFTIPGSLILFGFLDAESAEEAAEAVLRAFSDVLRSRGVRRLRGVEGLDDGDTASYAGVRSVQVASFDGPVAITPTRTGDTVAAAIDFVLACSTDL